jgi:polysaccharide biosynthesis transport protein
MRTRKQFASKSSFFVLVVLASGLLIWVLPTRSADLEPDKSPRAFLQVAAHVPNVVFGNGQNPEDFNRYLQTQFALIKSRLVLTTALKQPAIAQLAAISKQADAIAWLEQYLEVSNVKNSEIVQISFSPRSGASAKDQSAIINAVVSAYLEEVAGVETKRRTDRHSQLKKIKQTYTQLLKERREHVRKLLVYGGSGGPLSDVEQNRLVHRYDRLLDQRLKLRLDQAEAETLLQRRQKAANRESDSVRREIGQLEDRLAVVAAREKVLQEELDQVASKKRDSVLGSLDLKELNDEVAQMEEAALKVGAEVEKLNIELAAPPRIRVIENAVPPSS